MGRTSSVACRRTSSGGCNKRNLPKCLDKAERYVGGTCGG